MKKLLSFLLSIALTMSFCLSFVFTVSAEVLTDSETSADGFGSFDKKKTRQAKSNLQTQSESLWKWKH